MNAEIISVGTELVLGQVVNTNVPLLAKTLAKLDIAAPYQVTIKDERQQIEDAIEAAWRRADLIFVCGGLGPTADDVTLKSTAAALNTSLTTDQKHWQWIKQVFKRRQIKLLNENIQQARYLTGGQPLANPAGLALGSWYSTDGRVVVVLPGPPAEFKAMLEKSVEPRLVATFGSGQRIASRTMNFLGRPESTLMEEIGEATKKFSQVTVTSYVQPSWIQVRLTVPDLSASEAERVLGATADAILKVDRQYFFGFGDNCSLVNQVVSLLKKQGKTITGAESLTGGMFQSTICSVPGASNVFNGGFVTYAASAKEKLLGIASEIINQHGVVSAETAQAMAENSREKLDADFGLAFTGVAGPDALEGQVAGTVWLGLAVRGQQTQTKLLHLPEYSGRQEIRNLSVQYGLQMIYQQLRE